jgi:hypothetical protein
MPDVVEVLDEGAERVAVRGDEHLPPPRVRCIYIIYVYIHIDVLLAPAAPADCDRDAHARPTIGGKARVDTPRLPFIARSPCILGPRLLYSGRVAKLCSRPGQWRSKRGAFKCK